MEDLKQLLKSKGYRVTAGRLRLLSVLKSANTPLSIREIRKRMRGDLLDQVTLYRALESFSKSGLVARADLNSGVARYEYAPGKSHHHHLVCVACGIIEDVESCPMPVLQQRVLTKSKFTNIYSHNLEFFGSCKSCAK